MFLINSFNIPENSKLHFEVIDDLSPKRMNNNMCDSIATILRADTRMTVYCASYMACLAKHLDPKSSLFLCHWRTALAEGFAHLRWQAAAGGEVAVKKSFASAEQCVSFLDLLAKAFASTAVEQAPCRCSQRRESSVQPAEVVTKFV